MGEIDVKLTDARGLLDQLFEAEARVSIRTLRRWQQQGRIPFIKINHRVFFSVPDVRRALRRSI
jgi:hypothetical protein